MSPSLRVVQIGNFKPEHSTENHLRRALIENGHDVFSLQEDDPRVWVSLAAGDWSHPQWSGEQPDFILWTRTGWDWNSILGSNQGTAAADSQQRRMLFRAQRRGIPVVGYHLDRWFGLDREHQLDEEAFFRSDIVITADGGNQSRFEALGINHHWMPPGVSRAECELGTPRDEFRSKLAFVGSWQGHYHKEHQHRFELIKWLQKNFRRDCAFWPKQGQPAVRGADLRDLYASVDIVVGDSCFAGSSKASHYWSDRVPETIGRGGYLIHPHVMGLDQQGFLHHSWGGVMGVWDAGDWDSLGEEIEWALSNPDERRLVALAGREHVLQHHTYEVRVQQIVDLLNERNLLA